MLSAKIANSFGYFVAQNIKHTTEQHAIQG